MDKKSSDGSKYDAIFAEARRESEKRGHSYRVQALKLFPWICGRCKREFNTGNLHELTVHHRDHDHDNNPPDGSNWELLCIYCHENEHSRFLERHKPATATGKGGKKVTSTYKPFSDLQSMLDKKK